jgi:hypothetical protein
VSFAAVLMMVVLVERWRRVGGCVVLERDDGWT